MLYGYLPRFKEGCYRELTLNVEIYRIPEEIRKEAVHRTGERKVKNVSYDIGDVVFVKNNPTASDKSTKLQPRHKGPLVITEILSLDYYYHVQNLNNN